MQFIVRITRSERHRGGKTIELLREKFDAKSITAAKVKATKLSNETTFIENKTHWDGSVSDLKGEDLEWKVWDTRLPYTQDDGKKIGWSGKIARGLNGNYDPETNASPSYFAWVTLYWEITEC